MRTEDLIAALSADAATPAPKLRPAILTALGLSALGAAAVFTAVFHVRPDVGEALGTLRFPLKFVIVAAFASAGFGLAFRLARPGVDASVAIRGLLIPVGLLAFAVVVELFAVPSQDWGRLLFGRNWLLCLGGVPLLSAVPLALLLAAFRRGAPDRPAALGAAVGLLAGTVGALFYAAHCVDDSPLFVAAWYSLSIAGVTAAGAMIGARLLRW